MSSPFITLAVLHSPRLLREAVWPLCALVRQSPYSPSLTRPFEWSFLALLRHLGAAILTCLPFFASPTVAAISPGLLILLT
mmetsp:Transcript_27686/g.84512  ORF Transcript_27686/g.84512 Transcript_27686/m.84512 type:complete len:81 (+) Transcript_27686:508-750(+)